MNKEGASKISAGRYRKGDCYVEDRQESDTKRMEERIFWASKI